MKLARLASSTHKWLGLIVGFVIGGTSKRTVLVRAIGPSLAVFGVSDALSRPSLAVFQGSTVLASNDDWNTNDPVRLIAAFDRVGAFRLAGGGARDAALLLTNLAPGPYTIHVTGVNATSGTVLVEAYDVP